MIVIIHGPPAVGKSTLARGMSTVFGVPVLSRDQLAEELYDAPDGHERSSNASLHDSAHEWMFERLAEATRHEGSLIVEATLDPERAAERLRTVLAGTTHGVLEVFLHAPAQTLLRRYGDRQVRGRHRVHQDANKGTAQLSAHLAACHYRPLRLGGPLVEVDAQAHPEQVLEQVLDAAARLPIARRVYYDHEPAYRRIAARGGCGWDDRSDDPDDDSYLGLDAFIAAYGRRCRFVSVLDLGCGGGQAGLRFAGLAERIVGVDYAQTAIALARRNAAGVPQAHFEVGDITALHQLDDPFEVVLDNHALHCLVRDEHRAGMLAEVSRLLVPEGLFFCETMSREGRFDPAYFRVKPPHFTTPDETRRWVSADELDDELQAAGLVIIERRRRGPAPDDPPVGQLLWTVARKA